jgi:sialic acid synthase SpsE
LGIEACLYALSRGAQIIEKHFTLDKSETLIRDHALSATPGEFRDLVKTGTELFRIYNTLNKICD